MVIGDIRVIQADIPVKRPHTMSFTTLTAGGGVAAAISPHLSVSVATSLVLLAFAVWDARAATATAPLAS